MRYLVTITDNIAPTSMPYNEFVLYRRWHRQKEKQIVILLFKTQVNNVSIPEDIEFHCVGKSLRRLNDVVRDVEKRTSEEKAEVHFHIHEAKSVLFFAVATGGKYRSRVVYTLHSTFARYALHNKLLSALASFLSRKIVCVGKTSYHGYPDLLKKAVKDRLVSIQNGVDCERIDRALAGFSTDLPDSSQGLRLVYIARLIPLKRHDVLLQALRGLPDVKLTLIGKGKQKESLQALAKEYGISERVHFTGVVPRDEVYAKIKEHDVYVSSSSYEGLPISLLEAMSCGVVCAVSDIEQHREIQEKCPSLITVNNTPEDWVKAIDRIASMKPEERARIAAQNKRDVDRYFSLERMHAQYDRVYQEILEGNQ